MSKAEVEELLDEIEKANVLRERYVRQISRFNQPNLISVSSNDKLEEAVNSTPYSQVGFSAFDVQFKRPALEVKTLQLLSTNIPQSNANIPNTACAFWYYRLSRYSNTVPNPNCLFYVRLLPSYYKQEFIANPSLYGYNKTFNDYTTLSTELAKSCKNDLLFTNYELTTQSFGSSTYANFYVPYCPNDVSISYNDANNRFEMTGLQTQPFYLDWKDFTIYYVKDQVRVAGAFDYGYVALIDNLNLDPTAPSIPAWVSGSNYLAYNIVKYNNITYRCILAITGSTTTPNLDTTHFTAFNIAIQNVSDFWRQQYGDVIVNWDNNTYYEADTIVVYNGVLYKALEYQIDLQPDISPAYWEEFGGYENWYSYLITGYEDPYVLKAQGDTNYLEWNDNTLYQVNNPVAYNYKSFYALYQNKGIEPTPIPDWNNTTTYNTGNMVYYNITGVNGKYSPIPPYTAPPDTILPSNFSGNQIFICLTDGNKNVVPFANGTTGDGWGQYSLTGVLPAWSSSFHYVKNMITRDDHFFYICLQDNTNQIPYTSEAYWGQLLPYCWEYYDGVDMNLFARRTGLYGMSSIFDMGNTEISNFFITPFPYNIQGQPFNPEPKRLLNTILGFVWNGAFNPNVIDLATLEPSDTRLALSQRDTQLFNRLRPVPNYLFIPSPTLGAVPLPDPTSSVSLTYTADGYCNLVYSSVISIYLNIVGSSTLDTQRDTNLVAITSMNCANLGVAFWSNYVDNPIMKVNGDIYTLRLELRDEFGEPFYLTNNAVATFVFKATYENKPVS